MKPICVYSAPRVGSTALTIELAAKHDVPNLSEIFNSFDHGRRDYMPQPESIAMLESGKPFVWAFKPLQRTNKNTLLVDRFINASDVVKITRNNIVRQIVSFYLLLHSGVRQTNSQHNHKPMKLSLNWAVDKILEHNKQVDDFHHCQEHIIYEKHEFKKLSWMPDVMPKPKDYDDLCKSVSKILEQRGLNNV